MNPADLVERLRGRGRELTQVGDGTLQGLVLQAADEIERLRAALEEAAKVFDAWPTWDIWRGEAADTVRALKEKQHEPG